jgi:hypothetical protein
MTQTQLDPGPLQKALAAITAQQKAITDAATQQKTIEKEVHDYLASTDPNNREAINLVSAKKTQLEVFPHFFERAQKTLNSLIDPLYEEIKKFAAAFAKAGAQENAALTAIYSERVKPFFPRGQKGAANACGAITSIPMRASAIGHEHLANGNDGIPRMIETGILRAKELLGIYERWLRDGCRFRPEIWKGLGK